MEEFKLVSKVQSYPMTVPREIYFTEKAGKDSTKHDEKLRAV